MWSRMPSDGGGSPYNVGVNGKAERPAVHITLRPVRFVVIIAAACLVMAAFTIVATKGVVVEHVYDTVGSSKVANARTEEYNTWSGLVFAFVEVLLGLYMSMFMPVYDVYLHNVLWKAKERMAHWKGSRSEEKKSKSDATDGVNFSPMPSPAQPQRSTKSMARTTALFLFPIVVGVTFGNSLQSMQASNSTVGFQAIIIDTDLAKDQSELDKLVAKAAAKANTSDTSTYNTVLKNAIRQSVTPFEFVSDSNCSQKNATEVTAGERVVPINVHDLDTSSVVYGFSLRDWNAEALENALNATSSITITYYDAMASSEGTGSMAEAIAALSLDALVTAYDLLVHGKVMIEKAVGDSLNQNHSCSLSDYQTNLDGFSSTTSSGSGTTTSSSGSGNSNDTITTTGRRHRRRRLESSGSEYYDESGSDYYYYDESGSEYYDESSSDYYYEGDDSYDQWTYDENGTRICQGPVSSLYDLIGSAAAADPTVANLMDAIVTGLNKSFPDTFSLTETTMRLETYDVTSQISIQTLEIDAVVDASVEYGVSECTLSDADPATCNISNYVYDDWSSAFCGDDNCVFLDISETFTLQKEIGLIPQMLECSDVKYSGDYHGFFPSSCTKSTNSTFLYGIGTYISGDFYGSNDPVFDYPYMTAPRRHVTFSFAFMTWKLEDLAETFNADCDAGQCMGLWYKLESSGRYLFAGEKALPRSEILSADFHSPVQLVQVNEPSIYVSEWDRSVVLERLSLYDFAETDWYMPLVGEQCSMLMQSYIEQVEDNRYLLDRPLHPMYVSAFYYLMADAAITTNSTTSSSGSGSGSSSSAVKPSDALGTNSLKGDQQLRKIKISMPAASFKVSLAGCCFLVGVMVIILALPRRFCVEEFDEEESTASKYLAMRSEGEYSHKVYNKEIAVNDSGWTKMKMNDLGVTSMTLRARHEDDGGPSSSAPDRIYL